MILLAVPLDEQVVFLSKLKYDVRRSIMGIVNELTPSCEKMLCKDVTTMLMHDLINQVGMTIDRAQSERLRHLLQLHNSFKDGQYDN